MAPAALPEQQRDDDPRAGDAGPAPRPGRRERLSSHPATRHPYRVAVFVLGLLCIAAGLALAVLPGPLTIPPVLLGLWIWSWEFAFAQRFFDAFREKADAAWEAAKRRPVRSGIVTALGLAAAGVALWAVVHYELVARARDAVGV